MDSFHICSLLIVIKVLDNFFGLRSELKIILR